MTSTEIVIIICINMGELSRKAYKKIQEVVRLIHEGSEVQIKPRPIVITNIQLPKTLPEATFVDALEYLEENGLISYKYEEEHSAAYYDYDEKCRRAICFNDLEEDETWEGKLEEAKVYARKRDAEKKKDYFTTFTITLQPVFSEKYNDIITKHSGNVKYRMYLGDKYNNLLFINDYRISRFNAAWRQEIFKYALKQENGTTINTDQFIPKAAASKKLRGMPQILPEIIQSRYLRDVFFHDVHATEFKIYHTITDDMIEEGFCDTTLIDNELKKLSKKLQ